MSFNKRVVPTLDPLLLLLLELEELHEDPYLFVSFLLILALHIRLECLIMELFRLCQDLAMAFQASLIFLNLIISFLFFSMDRKLQQERLEPLGLTQSLSLDENSIAFLIFGRPRIAQDLIYGMRIKIGPQQPFAFLASQYTVVSLVSITLDHIKSQFLYYLNLKISGSKLGAKLQW